MILNPKRRSKTELFYRILKQCNDNRDQTKSYINQELQISFGQLNECIVSLLELGLLERRFNNKVLFKTTSKGKEYINKFSELLEFTK